METKDIKGKKIYTSSFECQSAVDPNNRQTWKVLDQKIQWCDFWNSQIKKC